MATPDEVIGFWQAAGPDGWYSADPGFDAAIRDRFLPDWQAAHDGDRKDWLDTAEGALAYLILTDQFPRNMFRGDGRSFATDARALAAARLAIARGWDQQFPEPIRQFFYLPFMHAEDPHLQAECQRLIAERLPGMRDNSLLHARAHARVIREFGRFPYRNDALGRETTAAEAEFLAEGGYRAALQAEQGRDA